MGTSLRTRKGESADRAQRWQEAGARERVLAIGKVEARAAGQVIKDDGNAAQAIADFLQRYQLL